MLLTTGQVTTYIFGIRPAFSSFAIQANCAWEMRIKDGQLYVRATNKLFSQGSNEGWIKLTQSIAVQGWDCKIISREPSVILP